MKINAAFAVGLALAGMLSAAPVQAQNGRSFVSAHGLDTNACTLAAPCRTLAAAFAATNAGGEIDVLDTAGYGSLTIDKAISIVNDGAVASVLVPAGGIGITVNAGSGDAISLRGLTIEGAGAGQTGIQFDTGQSLAIVNCVIRHVTGNGIQSNATSSATIHPSNLSVSNTQVSDNGGMGIYVYPSGGAGVVTAVFNRVEMNNNGDGGITVNGTNSTGTVNATVSESVAAGNGANGVGGSGFEAVGGSGQTTFMLFHSVAANNGIGIQVGGSNATLRAAQSMITGNGAGWKNLGGGVLLQSYADNYIDGNGSNFGSLTPISRQ
jgi:Right handed beta helix region